LSTEKSPDTKTGFSERLTQAREATGLSRRALARIAQVSEAHISRLELGQRVPSPLMCQALARALSVDAEWLASGRGKPRGTPSEKSAELARQGLPAAIETLLDRERLAPEVGRLPRPYVQRYFKRLDAVRAEAGALLETSLRDLERRIERELADFRARLLAEWRAERRRPSSPASGDAEEDER
jgi:transcriptional regulator with XRE-family HTH domain